MARASFGLCPTPNNGVLAGYAISPPPNTPCIPLWLDESDFNSVWSRGITELYVMSDPLELARPEDGAKTIQVIRI